ncbi:MAG TPA: peptidylprolyl isomerase [Candidatus Eisenbacteria bacterium]|nr:peptidylprolyl isomerase [Candidatus Eisenbacteria bacterium]
MSVFRGVILVSMFHGVLLFHLSGANGQTPPDTSQVRVSINEVTAPADTPGTAPAETTAKPSIPPPAAASSVNPLLLQPRSAAMTVQAPREFKVLFQTTKGNFTVAVHREWSPAGVDRFFNLVREGYYDEARFFRVLDKFMAQFGIHGDPEVNANWREAFIADEPVKKSNTRGRISFAKRGLPNTRTTQLFINTVDNSRLDKMGFGALGEVVDGMSVVDALYSGYGEGRNEERPTATGPEQARILAEGNAYLAEFPKLDYIVKATILK